MTEKLTCTITFSEDDITEVIQNLNPNKAHSCDQISIHMVEICGNTICKPLECVFPETLNIVLFPLERKKGNLVSVYKKGNKQCLKSYRPVFTVTNLRQNF